MDNNRHINVFPPLASVSPAQAVKLLANQISVFSGTEDDDVEVWIRKVERVASIHGVQDGVTLLAASSKLTKNAREWFDLDDGQINDSWFSFKNAIIKRFKRYVPFHVLMQKVESRKWNFPKESFHDYVLQKMKLMNNLQLPDRDRIQLIINGINSLSLRSTAAAIRTNSMDDFLEQMGQIISSCAINVKKSPPPVAEKERIKTPVLLTTESSSQSTKSNSAVSCVYCKAIGHVKADCFKLRKKNQSSSSESTSASASVAAPVTQKDNPSQVGCVLDNSVHTSKSSNSIVEISSINGSKCSMFALIDTGSPVSFMLTSPSKLLLGYEMKNHSDSKLVEFLTELAKTETSKNEELPWVNERDTSRKLAIEATDKIKE
ncbi:hypothetical protein ALC62_09289 [Cyphomyrmex costatus]|uniref:CCHC-type domain-containing protein n=1 Tax=Cyphomyrmex costatus TaxID=456900 RepID=A0A151IFL5_9HYME|nr:hypothetical protein ALC62_09289 [Cyphomyrmex costatus]